MKLALLALVLALALSVTATVDVTDSELAPRTAHAEALEGSIKCSICNYLVGQAESVLQRNNTLEVVITRVSQVCARAHVEDWCTDNLIPYITSIWQVRPLFRFASVLLLESDRDHPS